MVLITAVPSSSGKDSTFSACIQGFESPWDHRFGRRSARKRVNQMMSSNLTGRMSERRGRVACLTVESGAVGQRLPTENRKVTRLVGESPSGYGTCFGCKVSRFRVPLLRPGCRSAARSSVSHSEERGFESHHPDVGTQI